MSFGFLTESALLPSKSKPIKVDGRSLVDLKAVVYAKEQKVRQDGAGGAGRLRGLRGKRAADAAAAESTAARKDVFARSNKGVGDRSQRDEVERVTESKKGKAAERTMAAKSKLYEKMARGEVGGSHAAAAGSLVDFSRKTGADLALLEAKAMKPKPKDKKRRKQHSADHAQGKGKRHGDNNTANRGHGDNKSYTDYDYPEEEGEEDEDEDDDPTSAEVTITDEFGRDRAVPRGGAQHRAFLEARKAEAEKRADAKAQAEAYDERYSYRGNKGWSAASSSVVGSGVSNAPGGGGGGVGGEWAWSSGTGRGADEGDFETREAQDRKGAKGIAELLQRVGGGDGEVDSVGRDEGGAKILSQWEKTLTGDQKNFLREVQEETEVGRSRHHQSDRKKQREDRKELLRKKQEARAAAAAAASARP